MSAAAFAALHVPGDPLVLHNVWDAGSARAVAAAGAPAVATGSWSVAAAHGVDDGEVLPLADVLANARRIVAAVDVPVSVDFEGGYAVAPDEVAANVLRLAGTGAIGCNLEDGVIGGEGLHEMAAQAARIEAVRRAVGAGFFLNARTDLFLQAPPERHAALVDAAATRADAYAAAGASGVFVPGLTDPALVARLAAACPLPLNVMAVPGGPDRAAFARAGAARISHGPFPYRHLLAALTQLAGG